MDKYINIHIILLEEIENSSKLIKLGFGELQNIDQVNDFYYLPFQLISSGFERLMKCQICLGYFNKNGKYPDGTYLKSIGHDLIELLKEIRENYFVRDTRPIIIEDFELLSNDSELVELLNILSEFGKKARYYNLDFITGATKIGINPNIEWQKFESKIINSNKNIKSKILNWELHYEIYQYVSRYILILFERFVSALSRQFTFGFLGEKGNQFSMPVFHFAMLYDEDFGNTDYRKQTTRFKETSKSIHKRTFVDEIERKLNKNFKSKKISKEDFDGDWPFYSNEVIIECRHKHWCIITIDGYDYALNGAAKGKFKLEDPHSAGAAIVGKSIGDFIKLALEL